MATNTTVSDTPTALTIVALADLHPQQVRHRRAASLDRGCSHYCRAPGDHAVQQLSRDPDTG